MLSRPCASLMTLQWGSMASEPAVSVIVPIYNGAAHIRECLDSLFAQTLESLEIIVVDDASTDETDSILGKYVQRSGGRLQVLTQRTNQGVSAARNRGIDAARGAFVAFVDADDIVRPRMYEHLLELADSLSLDVASCGIQLFDGEGGLSQPIPYPMRPGVLYDSPKMRVLLETGFTSKLLWAPVRSLYRRSLIQAHDVRFDTLIRKGEDSLFNLEVLTRARGCAAVEDAYYLYRKHAGSVTARPLSSETRNLEELGNRVTRFFVEEGFPTAATDDFYRYVLSSDLPTALVRLAGHPGSREELGRLRSSHHVCIALRHLLSQKPRLPLRVWLLLLLFKYLPGWLVSAVLAARGRAAALIQGKRRDGQRASGTHSGRSRARRAGAPR